MSDILNEILNIDNDGPVAQTIKVQKIIAGTSEDLKKIKWAKRKTWVYYVVTGLLFGLVSACFPENILKIVLLNLIGAVGFWVGFFSGIRHAKLGSFTA